MLFGHLNGQYETLARLVELQPGDEVTVQAMERTYLYVVRETAVVPAENTEALAPTAEYLLTLITCAGRFDPVTSDYSQRIVVRGTTVNEGN